MELKSKRGVEIFSAGTWNGDAYTVEDLDEMVRAFNETCATWVPPLKLGHSENQALLQEDGYPAAGWIGKVYRVGQKLFADFVDIPSKIYDLIERGAYKKVSSEIFWEITIGGEAEEKTYNRMLAGVALLGADMPAVMNLSDIMEWYVKAGTAKKAYADGKNRPNLKQYQFESSSEEAPPMEKTAEQKKLEADKAALEAEAAELRKFKAEAETKAKADAARLAELEAKNAEAALDAAVADFGDKVSPAMRPYVKALLGTEKKEYSVMIAGKKDAAKVEKKYANRAEVLKDLLALHAEALKLNTSEHSVEGDEIPQGEAESAELDKKIREYAKAHKCSYGSAYKAVMAEVEAQESDDNGEE